MQIISSYLGMSLLSVKMCSTSSDVGDSDTHEALTMTFATTHNLKGECQIVCGIEFGSLLQISPECIRLDRRNYIWQLTNSSLDY